MVQYPSTGRVAARGARRRRSGVRGWRGAVGSRGRRRAGWLAGSHYSKSYFARENTDAKAIKLLGGWLASWQPVGGRESERARAGRVRMDEEPNGDSTG